MEKLWNDLQLAMRSFRRNPAFAAVAILTLALGIGANTAIFSMVNSVLLKPLAYREPGQLVVLQESIPQLSHLYPAFPANAAHFLTWRKECKSFQEMAAIRPTTLNLSGAGPAVQLNVARVSANLFHVLGVGPRIGRSFLEEEDKPGHDHVVILTDALWRQRFHSDAHLIGGKILLDDQPYDVIGILPPDFRIPKNNQLGDFVGMPPRTDLFKPMAWSKDDLGQVGDFDYGVIARLRPGVTVQQALAELNVVQDRIAKSIREDKVDLRGVVLPLDEAVTGHARRGLLLLLGAVAAVLLIVCVNLANLSLARATARRRESAIRSALGASRARLVRQVLTENLLLAFVGGALGVMVAIVSLHLLVNSAPVDLPRLDEVRLDGRVMAFAFVISALSGLLFGLVPAWRMSRTEPQEALQSGGSRSSTEGRRGLRYRELLVSFEVGLSAVLLITAGLLIHSFARLMNVDRGFEVRKLITAEIALPHTGYEDGAKRQRFYSNVVTKTRALPGVISAAMVSVLPLDGESWVDVISKPADHRPMMRRPLANYRFITPDYFRTMGIPLRAGRDIEETDQGRPVVLISENAATRLWPGENPIGKEFLRGAPDEKPYQIVGVVADIRTSSLQKKPDLMVYVPYWVRSQFTVALVARTAGDPRTQESAIRRTVGSVDSGAPVSRIRTMQQVMSESVESRRFQMLLIGLFAGMALLLASLGIYGVLAYSVARRTGEMGIRMALGARPGDVQTMVLRQGLKPVAIGLAAGIVGALALGRVLRSLLFEVSAADPATMAAVVAVLLAVAALACTIPARRAMRVDPMTALRYE